MRNQYAIGAIAYKSEWQRFFEKVQVAPSGCWLWSASRDRAGAEGYGRFRSGGKKELAHRWAFRKFVGPIPTGYDLDHLCRVRQCVNPRHLEIVTHRENVLRGSGWAGVHGRKTHCKNGHEFSPENTRPIPLGRVCRQCVAQRSRTYRLRQRTEGRIT